MSIADRRGGRADPDINTGSGPIFDWAVNAAIQATRGNINQPGPGQVAALEQAGYTSEQVPIAMGRTYTVWYDPQGNRVARPDVRPTAAALIRNPPVVVAPPPPVFSPPVPSPGPPYQPPPPGSGGSGSSGIPPSQPGGGQGNAGMDPNAPAPVPNVPVTVTTNWGQFIFANALPYMDAAIRYGIDYWARGNRPYQTEAPRSRRGPRGRKRLRAVQAGAGNPFPPAGPPPRPGAPAARRPARETPARLDTIVVPKRRMRDPLPNITIGQAEAILTAPSAPPAKTPLWLQLLPIIGPSLLTSLWRDQGNARVIRLTDPLTQPQGPLPGGNPFPLTGFQPAVQTYGAFGGTPGAVGTKTCECKAPRKKGRKKKRTVCYSGTYIERRDGTRKVKKRKVQCL